MVCGGACVRGVAGEGFFAEVGVASFDGFGDDLGRDSLLAQVLPDAALAELFVLLAKAGVGFGELGVIEVAVLLQARQDRRDLRRAGLIPFHLALHQTPQVGFGTHAATESLERVLMQSSFVEWCSGFLGASERHLFLPQSAAEANDRRMEGGEVVLIFWLTEAGVAGLPDFKAKLLSRWFDPLNLLCAFAA